MRPGHNLDVYEVVDTIEKMYNNLKADIELNTPDSYTSMTSKRQVGDEKDTKVGGIDMSKLETLASKLKGFDGKLDSLTSGITKKADVATQGIHQRVEDEIQHFQEDVVRDVQSHKAQLDREAREREAQARAAVNEGKQAVRGGVEERMTKLDNAASEQHARALETVGETGRAARQGTERTTSHASGSISNLVREISDIHQTAVEGGRAAAAQQIQMLAGRLGSHDNKHEETPHDGSGKST
jgi:hypothetical protein